MLIDFPGQAKNKDEGQLASVLAALSALPRRQIHAAAGWLITAG
jgi:hypothetical protein